MQSNTARKKLLFIGTGGTIASELSEGALSPALGAEQLLRLVPDVSRMCDADAVQLFELDSTDIMPEHWIRIADEIIRRYDDYDGFVIAHGTDTMAYTASALSYLIQNSRKPIVLTGAQKPIGFETTDSKQNLSDSFLCAASGMAGAGGLWRAGSARDPCTQNAQQELFRLLQPELSAAGNGSERTHGAVF